MRNWSLEQVRLAQALGLGPVWRVRGAGAPGAAAEPVPDGVGGAGGFDAAAARLPADSLPDSAAPALAGVETLDWDGLEQAVRGCTACGLCRTRTQTVFGVGSREARWMFVGEAPGAEEDAQGEPFVGQAGRLLDNMMAAAGLGRGRDDAPSHQEAVYIGNVIKCRPPGNRNPEADEVARCTPFLLRQIELLRPRILIAMGRFAAQTLLRTEGSIGSLRGRAHEFVRGDLRIPVVVTYHPAYLLRTPGDKAKAWEDLCLARRVYSEQSP